MAEQNPTINNITQTNGSINNNVNNSVNSEPPKKRRRASKSIVQIQKEEKKQEREQKKVEQELEHERKIREKQEKTRKREEEKQAKEQEKLRKQEERARKRAEKELVEAKKRDEKEKRRKEREEKAAKVAKEKENRAKARAMKRAMKAGIASESFVKFMQNKGINLNLDESKQIKTETTLDPENLNKILAGVRAFQASRYPKAMELQKQNKSEEDKFDSLCQRIRAKFSPSTDVVDVDHDELDEIEDDVSILDDSPADGSLNNEEIVEDGSYGDSEIEIPVLDENDKELEILRAEQIELERQIAEMKKRADLRKQRATLSLLKKELELLQKEEEQNEH